MRLRGAFLTCLAVSVNRFVTVRRRNFVKVVLLPITVSVHRSD